jgi:transposase InsO family protein
MVKFYYNNLLSNQNITARPDLVWVADITHVELRHSKKLYVFLCIDIHTNTIIAHTISKSTTQSSAIVKALSKQLEIRIKGKRENKLIIHTDRGTQFSSKKYNEFTEAYKHFFNPSMSRQNTPTDNAVAERFMRTFKEYRFEGFTLQETLCSYDQLKTRKSPQSTVREYTQNLNKTANKKSKMETSETRYLKAKTASTLMRDPKHPKAFSTPYGGNPDPRMSEIDEYKSQNYQITKILDEIATKKAEVVNNTPFDSFEDNLALEVIGHHLAQLYALIEQNPLVTKQYVEEAVEPINDSLEELHLKVDQLLPKKRKEKITRPLRDPVNVDLFPLFFNAAGLIAKYKRDLKSSQLKITYTILYHAGLRINEIRMLTRKEIEDAIKSSQFNIIHYKTQQAHIHVLSDKAVKDLKNLETEFKIVFDRYQYQYLFGKSKPIAKSSLIRMVNNDLKNTCQVASIPYNVKSHSFRINMITNLLKVTSVHRVAEIIGHQDIRSTMSYQRYALSKDEVKELLNKIENSK